MSGVKTGFLPETITLPLDKLLPSSAISAITRASTRYKMIEASVREVGIIEPLVVCPPMEKGGKHLLLDGHVRLEILRSLGQKEVTCIVSTDDEACTYNQRVNRLAPLQEYRMIVKAIDAGVPEERIAKALNVTARTIRLSRNKLADISPEALEHLKDKPIADMALRLLKKVSGYRQTEMAEMMTASNTYSASYARALFAATNPKDLLEPPKPDSRPEAIAKVETELRAIERDFVVLDQTYGQDTLNLQLARGYLKSLLQNARVKKYLGQKHGELLGELTKIVEVSSLEG